MFIARRTYGPGRHVQWHTAARSIRTKEYLTSWCHVGSRHLKTDRCKSSSRVLRPSASRETTQGDYERIPRAETRSACPDRALMSPSGAACSRRAVFSLTSGSVCSFTSLSARSQPDPLRSSISTTITPRGMPQWTQSVFQALMHDVHAITSTRMVWRRGEQRECGKEK